MELWRSEKPGGACQLGLRVMTSQNRVVKFVHIVTSFAECQWLTDASDVSVYNGSVWLMQQSSTAAMV
jgi:hypothetical protein